MNLIKRFIHNRRRRKWPKVKAFLNNQDIPIVERLNLAFELFDNSYPMPTNVAACSWEYFDSYHVTFRDLVVDIKRAIWDFTSLQKIIPQSAAAALEPINAAYWLVSKSEELEEYNLSNVASLIDAIMVLKPAVDTLLALGDDIHKQMYIVNRCNKCFKTILNLSELLGDLAYG